MRVALAHTVMLNGGDAAIAFAATRVLRKAFGDETELVVHDAAPDVAGSLYPEMVFAPEKMPRRDAARGFRRLGKPVRLAERVRLDIGGSLHANGVPGAKHALPRPERERVRLYKGYDLVAATGGTYLSETYDLRFRLADLQAAVMSGTPLVMLTQSLGPFRKPSNLRVLRRLVPRAAAVLLRDPRSRDHLLEIGADGPNVHVMPDLVFALADAEALERAAERRVDPLRVAVSVRDWPHFRSVERERGQQRYESAVAAAVVRLVRERGAIITFLSTCQGVPSYKYDDSEVAARIAHGLPKDVRGSVEVDRQFHTPQDLLDRLQSFSFAISTRMHFAILAMCVGTPVLPIAYEFKTTELFEGIGLGAWTRDIESLDPEAYAALANRFAVEHPLLVPEMTAAVAELGRKVNAAVPILRQAAGLAPEAEREQP